jgi:hypothetical protein
MAEQCPDRELQAAADQYELISAAMLDANATLETMTTRTPAMFLSDLRIHLCTSGESVAKRSAPPEEYRPALNDLLAVREAHNQRTGQDISAVAVGRFLTNVICFRQKSSLRPENQPELTTSFLDQLYGNYADDVAAFSQYPLQKPDLLAFFHPGRTIAVLDKQFADHPFLTKADIVFAFLTKRSDPQGVLDGLVSAVHHFKAETEPRLRQEYGFEGDWTLAFVRKLCRRASGAEGQARTVFDTMRELRAKYPKARPESIESWARGTVIEKSRKSQRLHELLSDLPGMTCEEEEVALGAEKLGRIRKARLADILDRKASMPNVRWSPEATRLTHMAEANWHDAFDAIDVEKEAPRIWAAAKGYNETLSDEEAHLTMSLDISDLYHMLVAFAIDVAALQEEGQTAAASRIAHFHDPGIYGRYKEMYKDDPLITPTVLAEIIAKTPRIIDKQIERWFKTMRDLECFKEEVTPGNLRRFAHMPDAVTIVQTCVDFGKEARQAYTWATRSDVEYFFVTGKEGPQGKFETWAQKVGKIKEHYPKRRDLSLHRRKQLAKWEGDAQKVVELYDGRVKELMDLYKREPRIRKPYAQWWAANSPESYLDIAKEHLVHCDTVDELLKEHGVELEDRELAARISFKSSDLKNSVEEYLERRSWLETTTRDNDIPYQIEQWMIDYVATLSDNISYYLLNIVNFFAQLHAWGKLQYVNATGSVGSHTTQGKSNPQLSILSTHFNESGQNRELIEEYFSWLSRLDQLALAVVFGFDDDSDKSELEKDLEVEDLNRYVFEEVVPHLLMLSRKRM